MQIEGRVAVVTGAASGIGRALARRFTAEGARGVVVADLDADGLAKVADEIGALAVGTDVSVEADVEHLVERTLAEYGQVDLFASNAGIAIGGGVDVDDSEWDRIWKINVMAHIYAARAVLPSMLERGEGYLLQTVSAAGLLSNIGAAPYSVTKHAALGLAEWLAITHGDAGIRVSCICPQGVKTRMLFGGRDPEAEGEPDSAREGAFLAPGALDPAEVADAAVAGIREERFLILPHPEVGEYFRRKADDYDRWLNGMRRLQARVFGGGAAREA